MVTWPARQVRRPGRITSKRRHLAWSSIRGRVQPDAPTVDGEGNTVVPRSVVVLVAGRDMNSLISRHLGRINELTSQHGSLTIRKIWNLDLHAGSVKRNCARRPPRSQIEGRLDGLTLELRPGVVTRTWLWPKGGRRLGLSLRPRSLPANSGSLRLGRGEDRKCIERSPNLIAIVSPSSLVVRISPVAARSCGQSAAAAIRLRSPNGRAAPCPEKPSVEGGGPDQEPLAMLSRHWVKENIE